MDRLAFRAHPLDEAMLYFQPATGVQVRVETTATRPLRRLAPRVVMFGITNRCNLRCSFCSRDAAKASAWTLDDAQRVLAGLHDAGTLEVAFGGGEPFAFRGFAELLMRLRDTTTLALHVTTNGTLLGGVDWPALEGAVGQVRLSIYDEVDWRTAASGLDAVGQRWGANVLVDAPELDLLPARLAELAALGASDVSLLAYVGPDPKLHLSGLDDARLGAIAVDSPLPVRVSVCFGSRIAVPLLFRGADDRGDCGAGRDFVTITSDRHMQSCSFQDASLAFTTSDDLLRLWREAGTSLARASSRPGCARATRGGHADEAAEGGAEIKVWQGFSGNNSGECIMVARFAGVRDAERYLAALQPGFFEGEPYSAPWRELFIGERVETPGVAVGRAPDELVGEGRMVFARTDYTLGDDFPELRALAWKRGGEVLAGGIQGQGQTTILFAMQSTLAEVESVVARARGLGERAVALRHGDLVLGAVPLDGALEEARARLAALASGPFSVELRSGLLGRDAFAAEVKRIAAPLAETPRIAFRFQAPHAEDRVAQATAFAAAVTDAPATSVGDTVLVDGVARKRRLALFGHRAGARVLSLHAASVTVHASLWRSPPARTRGRAAPKPAPLLVGDVEPMIASRLRSALGPVRFALTCRPGPRWREGVTVIVTSEAPREVLAVLAEALEALPGVDVAIELADERALAFALRRLIFDVRRVAPGRL